MPNPIGPRKRGHLIEALFAARHDVLDLAAEHHVTTEQLAAWAADEDNRRTLANLCALADLQSQLLLSRYRVVAANRLIRLATDEADDAKRADVARRACVDLLRAEVRADPPQVDDQASDAALRELMYGREEGDDAEHD